GWGGGGRSVGGPAAAGAPRAGERDDGQRLIEPADELRRRNVDVGEDRRRRRGPDLRRPELFVGALPQRARQARAGDRQFLRRRQARPVGRDEGDQQFRRSARAAQRRGDDVVAVDEYDGVDADAGRRRTRRDDERDGAAGGRLRAAERRL